jgi:hypothetical protein
MHDATVVQLGTTQSSFKQVDNVAGDPATLLAGCVLSAKSDGTHTLAVADGAQVGVSLGRSLSNTKRVPMVRRGIRVPVLLQSGFTTPTIGGAVSVHATSGKADSSGTAINAVYSSGLLTGKDEDGSDVNCALIDFPGGL